MTQGVTAVKVDEIIKPLLLKDLRIQCRARGLNPGGGKETLMERLRDNMLSTGNMCVILLHRVFPEYMVLTCVTVMVQVYRV
jgi:hypothetical protein